MHCKWPVTFSNYEDIIQLVFYKFTRRQPEITAIIRNCFKEDLKALPI